MIIVSPVVQNVDFDSKVFVSKVREEFAAFQRDPNHIIVLPFAVHVLQLNDPGEKVLTGCATKVGSPPAA